MPANEIRFDASAKIFARPEVVWEILSDYVKGHPSILPPDAFSNYKVLKGGHGEGTIITFVFRVNGVKRGIHDVVTVPEPGQTLVETTTDGSTATTFRLSPLDDGRSTQLTITTVQTPRRGLPGVIERLTMSLLIPSMQRIYQDEMQRLNDVAQRWPLI